MWRAARPVLALLSAYALALQVVLLAIGGPVSGDVAVAAQPICSHFGTGGPAPIPAGCCPDCLAACLAGCCAAPSPQPPAEAVIYTPGTGQPITVALELTRPFRSSAFVAHRSRAPPLG